MKTKYYYIDGLNDKFESLKEVRSHFWAYSENDRKEMNLTPIIGHNGRGEEVSYHWFKYKNGKIIISRKSN